jgi:hypothetical protein
VIVLPFVFGRNPAAIPCMSHLRLQCDAGVAKQSPCFSGETASFLAATGSYKELLAQPENNCQDKNFMIKLCPQDASSFSLWK